MNFARMFAFVVSIAAFAVHGGNIGTSLFSYRIPITVSGYDGGSPLTNFPVLVKLAADSPSGFSYNHCAANGSDLRFADSEGNLIPHEIDTWNASGESLVWVGLPVLTNNACFTMYYGAANPGAASMENLWSLAGYAGVWHLTDGHDSSSSGLNGTIVSGISAAVNSKLGGALDFDTAKMSVGTTPNSDLTSGFSLEAWCYPRRLADKNGKANSGNALFGKNLAMSVRVQGSGIQLTTPGVLDHDSANCAIAANQWFHLGLTFKPNTATSGKTTIANQYKVYRDGVQKASLGASRIPNLSDSAEMWIGGNQWSEQDFDGILDEFRLSYSIRSADWIKAVYDTAAAPASFVTLGAVVPLDATAPVLATPTVARNQDGSFTVSVEVSENLPASIVCEVGGADIPMTTSETSLPATYMAVVSGIASGTYQATVRAEAASGTIVSAACPTVFHIGALTVAAVSNADEGSLTPGIFRVSRADADATGLPALQFDAAYSGDGVAAVVPGSATVTIPAGAVTVDISVAPVFTMDVAQDADLMLTVSGENIGQASSATMTVVNAAFVPSVRYVATTGDDANHGGNLDFPKKTIAAAVASLVNVAQSQVCTVHVAPGTYTLAMETDNPITVTNAIRIVGDGETPEDVVVQRTKRASANSSTYRSYQDCSIFHLNHPDALVANLVMNYGSAHQPSTDKTAGSAWIGANGGTISNCVVRGGRAGHPWAITPGILVMGPGLVTHCVITNNVGTSAMESSWAGTMLGNAVVLKGAGSRLENCLIRDNRSGVEGGTDSDKTSTVCAQSTATIANCTIIGNRARNCGGVFVNGTGVTVRNCVIAGNVDVGATADNPNWMGSGTFLSCATDDATAINENCFVGTAAEFFKDYANGDYTPAFGGTLYNKGANYEGMASVDLAGKKRLNGSKIDIGCYEEQSTSLSIIIR